MKLYKKAILPKGFKANGISCGIKRSGRPDLALFFSNVSAKAACVFTNNKILAAPVQLNKKYLKLSRDFQAILVNSGNANSWTGEKGIKDAEESARFLAGALRLERKRILLASTGIIGRRLEVEKIKKRIPGLISGLSVKGIDKAKTAILTTDAFAKAVSVELSFAGKKVMLCGVAKGAGMIAPDMATMLSFVLTDASISRSALSRALKNSVKKSFNCITVDGCMSTNDSVMVLANSASGSSVISAGREFEMFSRALDLVCLELAKMIVRDAEGASKFIRIKVSQAQSFKEAKRIALLIANSSLFKTAMYGQSANTGRIVSAVGSAGVNLKEKDIKIRVSSLKKKDIDVAVSAGRGSAEAVVYTSDLTPKYIKINAGYN